MSASVATRTRPSIVFWIIAVVSLLWNLMGAFDYTATHMEYEPYMSQFSEEQLAYFYGFPAWVVAFWAIGVWGALAGSIGLLLRKRWAVWMFGASLLGMAISSIYTLFLSNGTEIMGTTGLIFSLVIWIVAIFLLLYSRAMAAKGVLT